MPLGRTSRDARCTCDARGGHALACAHVWGECDGQERPRLPPCTCPALSGHALHCARVLGDDPRQVAA